MTPQDDARVVDVGGRPVRLTLADRPVFLDDLALLVCEVARRLEQDGDPLA